MRSKLNVNYVKDCQIAERCWWLLNVEEGKWFYYFSISYLVFLGLDSIFEKVSDLYFTG